MMIFIFLSLLFISLILILLLNVNIFIELILVKFLSNTMCMNFMLDSKNILFILTVTLIFLSVLLYTFSYLEEEIYFHRFLHILVLFVISMFVLILSGSLFTSLIGWDGLGITSLFLILFYFSNASLKAGLLTFLMNRVGDCFLIMALTNLLLMSEDCITMLFSDYLWIISTLMVITGMTKSAQIPFSSWLPAAMEAPTPVSALVHSSTLVTAGIFILLRYFYLWESSDSRMMVMVMSMSTCLMASFSALVEMDLKKLIALSTLSQLGFIMFSLSLGQLDQSFSHMLTHAYFKALLFMSAGLMIHSFNSSQSIYTLMLAKNQSPVMISIMVISVASMTGLPFLSGFYSKDFIIDNLLMKEWSFMIMVSLIISFILTTLYSARLIWYLLNSSSSWNSMSDDNFKMITPMLPLVCMATSGGSVVTWLALDTSLIMDSSKIFITLFVILSFVTFWYYKVSYKSFFLESKWYLSSFNKIISNMFFKAIYKYCLSSDLLGLPGKMNKMVFMNLSMNAYKLEEMVMLYLNNPETLWFCMIIMTLTML